VSVAWTIEAEQDRFEVWGYIAADDIDAAIHMDQLFTAAADRLAEHPMMGAPGRIPGTRELVIHDNHRLVYEVEEDDVRVLALVHAARKWPLGGRVSTR